MRPVAFRTQLVHVITAQARVVAHVPDDPVFIRNGDNLYCEVPMTIIEAVLTFVMRNIVRRKGQLLRVPLPPVFRFLLFWPATSPFI